jgi:heat-inducible transcriptional repressor
MVLRGIIDSYINSNEPVGSRSLSKVLDIGLSPATIRNIMSDLSDMGFLMQTHTSAGRIPTDKAFRFYVDRVVVANQITAQMQRRIQEVAREGGAAQVENLLVNTTRLLAGLTQFVCLVTSPRAESSILRRIEFIRLSSQQVLVVLITKSGQVRNKIIPSSEDLSQEFLNTVATFLNDQFHNRTVHEIRQQILESMVEDKERYDRLLAQAVRLGKKAFETEEQPDIYIEGQHNIFLSNRFHGIDSARELMDTFDHKSIIVDLLDSTLEAEGVQIYIGVENELRSLQDYTMVTAHYSVDNNVLGSIGVIGPTNMDYQTVIPVVDYTARVLSDAITKQSSYE